MEMCSESNVHYKLESKAPPRSDVISDVTTCKSGD